MSDEVLVTLITGIVTITVQVLTLVGTILISRSVNQTHDAVNSKMSELLRITASSARAEGRLEGPDADV